MKEFITNHSSDLNFYISNIQVVSNQTQSPGWSFEYKIGRPYHGLVYVLDGSALIQFAHKEFRIWKNDIVFLYKGSAYKTLASGLGDYHFIVLSFELTDDTAFSPSYFGDMVTHSNPSYFTRLLLNLHENWENRGTAYKIKCTGILNEIIYSIINDCIYDSNKTKIPAKIGSAMNYIKKNYSSDISIEDIAFSVNLSSGHLRRLFKEALGLSPLEYLTNIRLEISKDLIHTGMLSISEIAEKVGIPDLSYYSKVFKQHTGRSPREYIQSLR